MNGYTVALFFHFLCVILASAAAAVTTFASSRLRFVDNASDASQWLAVIEKVVPMFPVAVLGLLTTGGYMTHQLRAWSVPWVDAAFVGLGLIVALGSGVEASRGRALRRELESSGLSPRARRLLRDPIAWSAKMTTLTLVVAVVFVMTVKPHAGGCVAAIVSAIGVGQLGAVPMWRTSEPASPAAAREASS